MNILVTGCAGFIGFHLSKSLINKKHKIYGLDNLNNYYDKNLKKDRLKELFKISKNKKSFFNFSKVDMSNAKKIESFFKKKKIKIVINLAAQAGLRYSIKNPKSYLKSNLIGFCNLIEEAKKNKVKHFIYASTSSVYGNNKKKRYSENLNTDHPLQYYAATKKSNEVIAYAYSALYNFATTGLRLFSVYGPWGRPDMAYFKFTKKILSKKKIQVYNYGKHERDFTYIDDLIEIIKKIIFIKPKKNKKLKKKIPHNIYNLGSGKSFSLMKMINLLEKFLKIKAKKQYLSRQPGDMLYTLSNSKKISKDYVFKFNTSPEIGIRKFINWYKFYFKKK